MEVSAAVKTAYHDNSVTKYLTLSFPEIGVTVGTAQCHYETMSLSEALVESQSIEFVGCIASKFKINVNGLTEDVKGRKIVAKIHTEGTEDEPVTLFNGIVDSAISQSNRRIKEITAYDELYTRGNTEVAAWYKGLTFPITLKSLRDSLFSYIGLTQVETDLPNDDVTIKKQYDPNTLQALSVIKAICQINGAFGIVNRQGKFEYRILGDIKQNPYPSVTLFPSNNLFPSNPAAAMAYAARVADEIKAEDFSFYRNVEYEEYEVKPIDKVTIRQSEDDAGVTYGNGENNYIIQGNIFAYGLSDSELQDIARNVYTSIGGFAYYPFESKNNGLPFLECGLDAVSFYVIDWEETLNPKSRSNDVVYEQRPFYVLNRELTGIQALKDTYSAKGEEYQSEFITDLQTQIDTIKKKEKNNVTMPDLEDYTYDKDTIDGMFENFDPGSGGEGFYIKSVKAPPISPNQNTLYVIQGEVVVE